MAYIINIDKPKPKEPEMNATTSNAETMSRIRELMAAVCAAKAAGRDDLAAELQAELDAAREARAAEYAARFPHWVLA